MYACFASCVFLKVGRPDLLIKRFLYKTRSLREVLLPRAISIRNCFGFFFLEGGGADGIIFCAVYTSLFVLSF